MIGCVVLGFTFVWIYIVPVNAVVLIACLILTFVIGLGVVWFIGLIVLTLFVVYAGLFGLFCWMIGGVYCWWLCLVGLRGCVCLLLVFDG